MANTKLRQHKRSTSKKMTRDQRKQLFLERLAEHGTVYHAAQAAGIGRRTVYQWKDDDEIFAERWDDAVEETIERLESSAYSRAMGGDTVLTIFLLKAARPTKYRENVHVRSHVTGKIDTSAETVRHVLASPDLASAFSELAKQAHTNGDG